MVSESIDCRRFLQVRGVFVHCPIQHNKTLSALAGPFQIFRNIYHQLFFLSFDVHHLIQYFFSYFYIYNYNLDNYFSVRFSWISLVYYHKILFSDNIKSEKSIYRSSLQEICIILKFKNDISIMYQCCFFFFFIHHV